MNRLTVDELTDIEMVILDYCEDAKLHGWTIALGVAFHNQKRCCPMFAVCGFNGERYSWADAAQRLGESTKHIHAFTDGFDARGMALYGMILDKSSQAFYEMGARFRQRVISGEL